jgi:hypothetical protein
MAEVPPFRFSIGSARAQERQMRLPLPDSLGKHAAGPRIRDYFEAIRAFLVKDRLRVLKNAAMEGFGRRIEAGDIGEIGVSLEKHGAFYHPARVDVFLRGRPFPFALNVAVSRAGLETISREYLLLKALHRDFLHPFLPRVFSIGEVATAGGTMRMFLAEWLEGFHEFHLTAGEEGKIVVWETETRHTLLSPGETAELYRLVARILTCYYDPRTFRQIYPWHHAAGDFVLRRGERGLEVRLITARQYAPLIEAEESTAETMLHAIFLFFLNLSIRTRLDRADGTGAIQWAPEPALPPTLEGFIDALSSKGPDLFSGEDAVDLFRRYAGGFSEKELNDLSRELVDACDPRAPEISTIRENLPSHAALLHRILSEASPASRSPPAGTNANN